MIFVALGTQKQSLKRVLEYLKDIPLVVQNGHTKVENKNHQALGMISLTEMEEWIKKSDLVITHGGGGTVFLALRHNKKVIVTPRLHKYKEHVNDHQVEFTEYLVNKKYVLSAYSKEELLEKIETISESKLKKYKPDSKTFELKIKEEIEMLLK